MAKYTVDSVPGVLFDFIGYETREDGSHDYSFAWLKPVDQDTPEVYPIMQIHTYRKDDNGQAETVEDRP